MNKAASKTSKAKKIINVENLSVNYRNVPALTDMSFTINSGQVVGIVGPNGAGKTTLIKAILGLIPYRGSIRVWNDSITKHLNKIAYVPQHKQIDIHFPISVEETVMIGRYHYLKRLNRPTSNDKQEVAKALKQVSLYDKRDKQIGQLSGGERQRMFLARALAQHAELILLDEPLNGIDFKSEQIIMDLLTQQSRHDKTLLVVHHDIAKASQYFHSVILINQEMIAAGKTELVLTNANLASAYQGNLITKQNSDNLPEQDQEVLVITK